jgi:hypothetical protein
MKKAASLTLPTSPAWTLIGDVLALGAEPPSPPQPAVVNARASSHASVRAGMDGTRFH